MTHTRLTKSPGDRVWAGVCAGIARWLNVDPVLIRLAWLAWAVFGDFGPALLAYFALMIILPNASRDEWRAEAARRERPPAPTADERGDVLLKLLDATAAVAANVARAAVLAARAAFVTGSATYRATNPRSEPRPAAAPPSAGATVPPSTPAPIPVEPHIESDEERLHRQIRERIDQHASGARAVIAATGPQRATGERTVRRGRLRQLAGFGVLAFGTWGLVTALGLEPLALSAAAIPTFASAAVVIAAALVCLGTYLLWTALRRHP